MPQEPKGQGFDSTSRPPLHLLSRNANSLLPGGLSLPGLDAANGDALISVNDKPGDLPGFLFERQNDVIANPDALPW